jgi:hypothetical protein
MNHARILREATERGTLRLRGGYAFLTVHCRTYGVDVTITIDRTRATEPVVGLLVTRDHVVVPSLALDLATPADRASAPAIYRWLQDRLAMGMRTLRQLDDERKALEAFWARAEARLDHELARLDIPRAA